MLEYNLTRREQRIVVWIARPVAVIQGRLDAGLVDRAAETGAAEMWRLESQRRHVSDGCTAEQLEPRNVRKERPR
jgi:hypothetical protein